MSFLEVNVVEARKLPAADKNGLSDPYVRLSLGRQRKETTVIPEQLNPLWNQEFEFSITTQKDELLAEVWDKDTVTRDDFLGMVRVPVSAVMQSTQAFDQWFPLHKRDGSRLPDAKLRLVLRFVAQHQRQSTGSSDGRRSWEQLVQEPVVQAQLLTADAAQAAQAVCVAWSWPHIGGAVPDGCVSHASVLYGHSIVTFGGARGKQVLGDLAVLDTRTMQWAFPRVNGSTVPSPRYSHTMVLWNKKLWVFGGADGKVVFNDLFALNPANMTWSHPYAKEYTGFPSPRLGHTACMVGSKMFVFGGFAKGEGYVTDIYYFDFVRGLWYRPKMGGDHPPSRLGHSAVAVGNKMFVFGGSSQGRPNNDLYILDTFHHSWKRAVTRGPKPSPRFGHSATLMGSKMVIFGGDTSHGPSQSVHALDIATLTWTTPNPVGHLPFPRAKHQACLVNHCLLVFGGGGKERLHNDVCIASFTRGNPSSPPAPAAAPAAAPAPVMGVPVVPGASDGASSSPAPQ